MTPGFRSSNIAVAYPIADDAPGILSGLLPAGLLADAAIDSLSDPGVAYLRTLYIDEGTGLPRATIYAAGVTVTLVFAYDSGAYRVLAGSNGTCYAKLLLYVPASEGMTPVTAPGTELPFAAGVAQQMPGCLYSVTVRNGGEAGDTVTLQGDITITAGYNMDAVAADGVISLASSAGAGLGVVPCDNEDAPRGIPGLSPDDGNINIAQGDEDCYQITVARGATPGAVITTIDSKCGACCSCADYKAAYDKLAASAAFLAVPAGAPANPLAATVKETLDRAMAEYLDPDFVESIGGAVTCSVVISLGPTSASALPSRAPSDHKARIVVRVMNRTPASVVVSGMSITLTKPLQVGDPWDIVPITVLDVQAGVNGIIATQSAPSLDALLDGVGLAIPAVSTAYVTILLKAARYPASDDYNEQVAGGFLLGGAEWAGTVAVEFGGGLPELSAEFVATGLTADPV